VRTKKRLIAETTLTSTEAALLGMLARGGARSGYDIRKGVERSVGYFWAPAKSQIYAVLPRLVEAGLLTRRDVAQTERPDKQLYRITAAGRRALVTWLEDAPLEPEPDRNPLLLKVFFGGLMSQEALIRQIREQRREAETLKADLDRLDAEGGGEHDLHPSLTRAYGHEYANAIIRWARKAERTLGERG